MRGRAGWIALVVVAAALAWHPVLHAYFFADDYLGLFALADHGPWPFLVQPHGGHLLFLRNLAFWLCWVAFGAEPTGWFATALVTHALNGVLLFFVLVRVVRHVAVAGAVAALWAVAPAHEGSLAWYAVYGHALATTFVLVLLLDVLRWRERDGVPSVPRTLGWCLLLVAAGVSYGVGLGVAAAAPVAIALLVPATRRAPSRLAIVALVPVLLALAWFATARQSSGLALPGLEDGGASGGIRPLADLLAILQVGASLVAFGLGDLVLGPWERWLAQAPAGVLVAGVAVALLLVVAVARTREPRLRAVLVATVLLALAAYGSIAAARAGLYAALGVAPDATAAVPRYHYLAQTLLAAALGTAIVALLPGRPLDDSAAGVAGLVALLVALPLVLVPYAPDVRANTRRQADEELARLRRIVESVPPGEEVRIKNTGFGPMKPVVAVLGPGHLVGLAAGFVIHFPSDVVDGRTVRFVARDDAELSAGAPGGRLRALLLPPDTPATPVPPPPAP